jgi:hypothetical protein
MLDQRSQERPMFHVPMFSAIGSRHRPTTLIDRVSATLPDLPRRSSDRPTTLIHRVTAALPDLPRPRRKRHRRATAIALRAVAGLVVVLVATAVIFRKELISIVRRGDGATPDAAGVGRGDGGEQQAPDASKHKLASAVRAAEQKLASIVSHDGGEEKAPVATGR